MVEFENFRVKLDDLNVNIGQLGCEEAGFDIDGELKKCEEYDEKILSSLKRLKARMSALRENSNGSERCNVSGVSNNHTLAGKLKMPELPLPQFSNEPGENLSKFFYNFEKIICNYNLNEYEKFVFLAKQLGGSPRKLIKSLEGDEILRVATVSFLMSLK